MFSKANQVFFISTIIADICTKFGLHIGITQQY